MQDYHLSKVVYIVVNMSTGPLAGSSALRSPRVTRQAQRAPGHTLGSPSFRATCRMRAEFHYALALSLSLSPRIIRGATVYRLPWVRSDAKAQRPRTRRDCVHPTRHSTYTHTAPCISPAHMRAMPPPPAPACGLPTHLAPITPSSTVGTLAAAPRRRADARPCTWLRRSHGRGARRRRPGPRCPSLARRSCRRRPCGCARSLRVSRR